MPPGVAVAASGSEGVEFVHYGGLEPIDAGRGCGEAGMSGTEKFNLVGTVIHCQFESYSDRARTSVRREKKNIMTMGWHTTLIGASGAREFLDLEPTTFDA